MNENKNTSGAIEVLNVGYVSVINSVSAIRLIEILRKKFAVVEFSSFSSSGKYKLQITDPVMDAVPMMEVVFGRIPEYQLLFKNKGEEVTVYAIKRLNEIPEKWRLL